MADKVVLAEDSYRADCAHCHTAYHHRGYSRMEAFAAVCRRVRMEAYRVSEGDMEAYRVSAGDMDWN